MGKKFSKAPSRTPSFIIQHHSYSSSYVMAASDFSSKSLPVLSELDDFEIYMQGYSSKGALLTGSFDPFNTATHLNSNHNNNNGSGDQDGSNCFLQYSKFEKPKTRPLPLPKHETLKFIDIGLQFTTLLTHSNKVYLFGDFPYVSFLLS